MNRKSNFPIFITALLSVILIFVSLWYVNREEKELEEEEKKTPEVLGLEAVRTVQEDDHILGNPNAPVVLYVYSDFACPYCKDFYKTMKRIMSAYGRDGRIVLVYRHLPFVQIHREAPMYAHASKCVASEAGNPAFWKFADTLFEKIVPNTALTAAEVVLLAEESGVSRQAFVACMRSNKFMEAVEIEYNEGLQAGGKATPFTIVEAQGKRTSFVGAHPDVVVAGYVNKALSELGSQESPQQQTSPFELNQTYQNEFDVLLEETLEVPTTQGTSSEMTATGTSPSILDGIVPR